MLIYIHFTSWSLLLLILLLTPLAYYVIKAQDKERDAEPITPIDNPMNFDDLAPIDNAEQSEAYLNALRWSLSNPKIKNIAVTGPYGSGKSSVLDTFRKKYEADFKFLAISLASFGDGEKEEGEDKENRAGLPTIEGREKTANQRKNETQQLIELSVLQQIFYKVDQTDIPGSRFKRISGISKSYVIFFASGVLAFLFGAINLIFPKQSEQLSFIDSFSKDNPDAWHLFLLALVLPGIVWIIVFLIQFFTNSGIKKLNISSGEIEINPKSEASILNRYLDELVYFFSATDFNVILIEDMDRFSDPEIFTKLRELNTLLNSSRQVGRRIVFIYAIKDDMFPDERTRTKFFDFIIPIIPIVNWSNSLQKLKDKLEASGFNIDSRFVTAITLYIDDMRVLKNIFNELILYKEALSIPDERQTKLLAMIAYKNIYPNDFAALHEEKGMVHDTLLKAQEVRKLIVEDFEKKIALKEAYITNTEGLLPRNIKELRAAYIIAVADKIGANFSYFYIEGVRQSLSDMQDDKYFKILTSGTSVPYYSSVRGPAHITYSFAEIEDVVSPGQTYAEREKMLKANTDAGLAKLRKELADIEAEQEKVKAYTVSEVIRTKPDHFPNIAESIIENRLLRYLLSEGYIDLSYPYLISYFYPGTIGRADMKFLTYVNDRIALAYDYSLEKPDGLIDMLSDYDFERDVIYNVDLLNAMLANRARYSRPIDKLVAQLNNKSKRSLEFIAIYLEKGSSVPSFVYLLCKAWPGIFEHYHNTKGTPFLDDILKLILSHADLEDLPAINKNYLMTHFINTNYSLIASFAPSISAERMNCLLEKLAVEFEVLVPDEQSMLYDQVYEGYFYAINYDNVVCILHNKNKNEISKDALQTANYSAILASDCEPLYNYIDLHIGKYVDDVLLKLPATLKDSEEDVIKLLNDKGLSIEQKQSLIKKETAIIRDLKMVDNAELYPDMLRNNRVAATWPNILHYSHEEIDEHLLFFLNNIYNAFDLTYPPLEPTADFDQAVANKFEELLIKKNEIKIESYRELLEAFSPGYENLDTKNIDQEKVAALIEHHLIFITPENFTELKNNHPPLHISLLLDDVEELFEQLNELDIDNDDRLALLANDKLEPARQLQLIDTITPEMISASTALATRITELLVSHNKLDIGEATLLALTAYSRHPNDKLVLFDYHLPSLNTATIRQILYDIGGDYATLNSGRRPKMDLTPINESIAAKLLDKKYITSAPIKRDKGTIRFISRS